MLSNLKRSSPAQLYMTLSIKIFLSKDLASFIPSLLCSQRLLIMQEVYRCSYISNQLNSITLLIFKIDEKLMWL